MILNNIITFIKNHFRSLVTAGFLIAYYIYVSSIKDCLDKLVGDSYVGALNFSLLAIPFIVIMIYFFLNKRDTLFSSSQSDNIPTTGSFIWKLAGSIELVVGIGLMIALIFFFLNRGGSTDIQIAYIIDTMLLVVAATIVYKYLAPKFQQTSSDGIVNVIKQIMFYIPCLVLQLVGWVKEQYKITTKPVWILLGLEIALIGLRFLLPWVIDKIVNHQSQTILKSPVYLNNSTTVGDFQSLNPEWNAKKDGEFTYNYAISGWFFINPQPPNTSVAATKSMPIMSYGGKPAVLYDSSTGLLSITMDKANGPHVDDGKKIMTIAKDFKLPLQKWNNIILNMKAGSLDVFVNGELIMASADSVPFMSYDTLTVGHKDGTNGSVTNVQYFYDPLSLTQISVIQKMGV